MGTQTNLLVWGQRLFLRGFPRRCSWCHPSATTIGLRRIPSPRDVQQNILLTRVGVYQNTVELLHLTLTNTMNDGFKIVLMKYIFGNHLNYQKFR